MKRKRIALLILLSSLFSYAFAGQSISTAFTDVKVKDVPLGKPYRVRSSYGEGISIQNLDRDPIRMRLEALTPRPDDLRGGATPIPDLRWITILPATVDIPGKQTGQSQIVLTVPKDRAYAGKMYQVTIWAHSIPLDGHAVEFGAGLLCRLIFTVKE